MAALALGIGGSALSMLGGFMGRSAARKAAAIQAEAARQAQERAVQAGATAGQGVTAAAGDAANAVNTATGQANDLLTGLYNQRIQALSPYQDVGAAGANALLSELGPGGDLNKTFTASDMAAYDPGYAFRLSEGQRALGASQAAAGGALGGGALKQAMRYGQDYASSEYQNAFNRFMAQQQQRFGILSGAAGIGQRASDQALQATTALQLPVAQNTIGAAQYGGNAVMNANQYAGNMNWQAAQAANEYGLQGANAQAGGIVGGQNALTQGMQGAINAGLGAYSIYQAGQNGTSPSGTQPSSAGRPWGWGYTALPTPPNIGSQPGQPPLWPNYLNF